MRTRIIFLVALLVISGCGSGITEDELDQAVADAVAAATATTTPGTTATTTPSGTTAPPAPTTTVQRNISESAKEGQITYDIGILTAGTCTQIVREIEDIAGVPGSKTLLLFPQLVALDPDGLPTLETWHDSYLGPAWNIIGRVDRNDNLPLHLTAYASNVSSALGVWAVATLILPSSYDNFGVSQWLDSSKAVSDAVKDYPPCDD